MKPFSVNDLLKENDRLHKKLDRHREIIKLYKDAVEHYARIANAHDKVNVARDALEQGRKLEKFL